MRAVRHRHRQPAQALVEFAVVVPMFLTMVFLVLETGRFGASYMMVTNAAREVAHAGSFAAVTTDAPLRAAANQAVPLLGALPDSAFSITPAGTDAGGPGRPAGSSITATVTYGYSVFAVFSGVLGTTIRLSSTAVAMVE